MYAGMDASGTPDLMGIDPKHNPYVVCVAAVADVRTLECAFAALRLRTGMRAGQEFHAHRMRGNDLHKVLATGEEVGMAVGALVLDKVATRRERELTDLPPPPVLQQSAALALLDTFTARYPLADLRFDEEFQGRRQQTAFCTAAKRLHRARWPGRPIKVRPSPSHQSDLIQLADVIAYVLGRKARNAIQMRDLAACVERLQQGDRHIILGPQAWDR